jgi:hypothetical protein
LHIHEDMMYKCIGPSLGIPQIYTIFFLYMYKLKEILIRRNFNG